MFKEVLSGFVCDNCPDYSELQNPGNFTESLLCNSRLSTYYRENIFRRATQLCSNLSLSVQCGILYNYRGILNIHSDCGFISEPVMKLQNSVSGLIKKRAVYDLSGSESCISGSLFISVIPLLNRTEICSALLVQTDSREICLKAEECIRCTLLKDFSEHFEESLIKFIMPQNLRVIIGRSEKIRNLKEIMCRTSLVDFPVLITGESGTGKELVARGIHMLSRRKNFPFVAVNCAAIPENLLESEFFGVKKGAFTGAYTDRKGLFEEADKGVVFLDEIGDLPLLLQAKLLRVIQEKFIKKVGSNVERKIDVRFLSATNRDLLRMVNEGDFRDDLYYRLQDICISVPPLRERVEDIPDLVEFFLKKNSCESINVSDYKELFIRKHIVNKWPGNIRELESMVKRFITFYPNEILVREGEGDYSSAGLREFKELFEKEIIKNCLLRNGGIRSKTADELRVSRMTLFNLIKKYNL